MAITITWGTKVINVPKADMTLLQSSPFEIRELNINTFRLNLKDLEDGEEGMAFIKTHEHVAPITVGGVTLARVVELINGYTVTFENGSYAVNLAGGNSNIADKTNLNSVSVRAANSAGLIQTREIEHSSYNGHVAVDTVSGTAGSLYPIGTESTPVSNWTDALLIANNNKLREFLVMANTTLPSGTFTNMKFKGVHPGIALTVDAAANVSGCTYERLTLSGTLDADTSISYCTLNGPIITSGTIEHSYLKGTITLVSGDASFINCVDGDPSGAVATLDCGGAGSVLAVRDYFGGLALINKTGTEDAAVDLRGRLILNNTVTAGNIIVRGVGHIEGAVGGTATVDSADLVNNESVSKALLDYANAIESGLTPRQALRVISAALAGKLSGAPLGPIVVRNTTDTKDRITATVDLNGNRTAVTIDGT